MAFPSDISAGLTSASSNVYWGASLPGQSNATGNRDTLFLKQMGSEIARALHSNLTFLPTVTKMQFRGKAIQLPYFGKASVGYQGSMVNMLDPTNQLLTSVRGAERSLYPDKPLVNGVMVDEWDELISHLPTRMIYTEELGRTQALALDNIVARNIAIGSAVAADAIYTGHPGGTKITLANSGHVLDGTGTPSASTMATAIRSLRIAFDEKNVPMEGRKIALNPKNYSLLQENTELFDVDYSPEGNGSLNRRNLQRVSGFEIVVTTNGPFQGNSYTAPTSTAGSVAKVPGNYELALGDKADATAEVYSGSAFAGSGTAFAGSTQAAVQAARENAQLSAAAGNSYVLDAGKLVALAWAPRAVVMGTLRGLKLESDYKTEYGGTLLRLSQIQGCTYWMPEACGSIVTG